MLDSHMDQSNYSRVCLYLVKWVNQTFLCWVIFYFTNFSSFIILVFFFVFLSTSCAVYVEEPERGNIVAGVMRHYLRFKEYPRALCLAMQLNKPQQMIDIFNKCEDPWVLFVLYATCFLLLEDEHYIPIKVYSVTFSYTNKFSCNLEFAPKW